MAFPAGLTPKTVTIGTGTGFDGVNIPDTSYVVINAPYDVVWQPTGDPIFALPLSRKFTSGQAAVQLVPTDLDGLSRVDWTYTAVIKIPGRKEIVRHFLLPASGPSTVDLDAMIEVPSSAGTPVSVPVVTSVNGQTGDVVVSGGGGGGGSGIEYTQTTPSASWSFTHALGRRPAVSLYVAGVLVDADVTATSTQVSVVFPTPTAGTAVLV